MNQELLGILKERFEMNNHRHNEISWDDVEDVLATNEAIVEIISKMEISGGEPDVIYDGRDNTWFYADCSLESPSGRRSLCYDQAALDSRKKNKPEGNALSEALKIGGTLIDEDTYRYMQTRDVFDTKTSSWIVTPKEIRNEGGALFCDRRYNAVFTYHNGADSYYGARGFRVIVRIV